MNMIGDYVTYTNRMKSGEIVVGLFLGCWSLLLTANASATPAPTRIQFCTEERSDGSCRNWEDYQRFSRTGDACHGGGDCTVYVVAGVSSVPRVYQTDVGVADDEEYSRFTFQYFDVGTRRFSNPSEVDLVNYGPAYGHEWMWECPEEQNCYAAMEWSYYRGHYIGPNPVWRFNYSTPFLMCYPGWGWGTRPRCFTAPYWYWPRHSIEIWVAD